MTTRKLKLHSCVSEESEPGYLYIIFVCFLGKTKKSPLFPPRPKLLYFVRQFFPFVKKSAFRGFNTHKKMYVFPLKKMCVFSGSFLLGWLLFKYQTVFIFLKHFLRLILFLTHWTSTNNNCFGCYLVNILFFHDCLLFNFFN